MTIYVLANKKIVLKYPYTYSDLRKDNPNVSFPESMSNEELATWNVFPVYSQSPPEYNPIIETVVQLFPTFINGTWIQNWNVVKLSEEKVLERVNEESLLIRQKRNSLLLETDWTQLPNSPVNSVVWETYRQKLRDLTLQKDFPFNINWPVKPEN